MDNFDVTFFAPRIEGATVVALDGREAISEPYRYQLELISPDPALPLEELVGARARLSLGGRAVHGVIWRIEQGAAADAGGYRYHLTLCPWLARLGVGRQSRVFQRLSVPEIVMAVCAGASGADARALELRLRERHRARDYVVQYAESDLAFVSRLLEEEGISYFFEQGVEREQLVVCDHNGGFRAAPRHEVLELGRDLASLSRSVHTVPAQLLLSDDHEDEAALPLHAEAEVDPRGAGLWAESGARFQDPEDGQRLAAIRAEELLAARATFRGASALPLAAGAQATIAGHFRPDYNRALLVTAVTCRWHGGALAVDFDALSADTAYRPPRRTPRPRIHGLMRARLEAGGDGEHAAVDAAGRYRVIMPFDQNGQVSRAMRLAQPYGAEGSGIHFPLPQGAEVVWSCLDGDPDRPVIAGAVAGAGARASRGPLIEARRAGRAAPPGAPARALEEQPHLAADDQVHFASSQDDAGGGVSDTWLRFYVPHKIRKGRDKHDAYEYDDGKTYLRIGERPEPQADDRSKLEHDAVTAPTSPLDVNVHYTDKALHETVTPDGYTLDVTWASDADRWKHADLWGVFDYTDGTRTVITRKDKEEVVGGRYRLTVQGGTLETIDAAPYQMWFGQDPGGTWRKVEVAHGSEARWFKGDRENYFFGYQLDATMGLTAGLNVVGAIDVTVGARVSADLMLSTSYVGGRRYEFTFGKSISHASDQDLKAAKSITLRVKPGGLGLKETRVFAAALTGVAAGALAGLAAGGTKDYNTHTSQSVADDKGLIAGSALVQGAALGVGGGMLAHTLMRSIKGSTGVADPELKLTEKFVNIKCGKSEIHLLKDQIRLKAGKVSLVLHEGGITLDAGSGSVGVLGSGGAFVDGDFEFCKKLIGDTSQLGLPAAKALSQVAQAKAKLTKLELDLSKLELDFMLHELFEMLKP